MQSQGGIMVPLTTRALDSKTLTKGSEVVTDALQSNHSEGDRGAIQCEQEECEALLRRTDGTQGVLGDASIIGYAPGARSRAGAGRGAALDAGLGEPPIRGGWSGGSGPASSHVSPKSGVGGRRGLSSPS
jgi:hypothetical protein